MDVHVRRLTLTSTGNFAVFATCPKCGSVFRPGPVARCPACGTRLGTGQADATETRDDFFARLGDDTPAAERPADPAAASVEEFAEAMTDLPGLRSQHARFLDTLDRITPHVFVTQTIVAANLLIFLAMALSSGGFFLPSVDTLKHWQANFGPDTLDGEWWRLLTSTFIHVGVIHVALNMWILWDLGKLVERLVGNAGFLLLYLLSGISGSLASVYWEPDRLSAGASGAVFGAFGALMGFILFRGDSVPKHILSSLRNSGLTFLAFNLVFGLTVPFIDNAAHLGGLAAGFVCGVSLSQPLDRVTVRSRAVRNLLVLAAGSLVLGLAVLGAPDPPPENARAPETILRQETRQWSQTQERSFRVFEEILEQYQRREIDSRQAAEAIEERILADVRQARKQLDSAESSDPDARAGLADLQQRAARLEQGWMQVVDAFREDDQAKFDDALKRLREQRTRRPAR